VKKRLADRLKYVVADVAKGYRGGYGFWDQGEFQIQS
jgi:hypothetical protein